MEIRVSKESEVPVRQQLAEQIAFLIATNKLKAGDVLPSVRELARRLGIHHNTVSHAYQDLVRRTWLLRRRGTRVVVRSLTERKRPSGTQNLDELIDLLRRWCCCRLRHVHRSSRSKLDRPMKKPDRVKSKLIPDSDQRIHEVHDIWGFAVMATRHGAGRGRRRAFG